jgi:hypothetical protein
VVETKQVIGIQQVNPQVIYVPAYNPVVVYGPPIHPYPLIYPLPGYYAAGVATVRRGHRDGRILGRRGAMAAMGLRQRQRQREQPHVNHYNRNTNINNRTGGN